MDVFCYPAIGKNVSLSVLVEYNFQYRFVVIYVLIWSEHATKAFQKAKNSCKVLSSYLEWTWNINLAEELIIVHLG